jgi:hypothetical protein
MAQAGCLGLSSLPGNKLWLSPPGERVCQTNYLRQICNTRTGGQLPVFEEETLYLVCYSERSAKPTGMNPFHSTPKTSIMKSAFFICKIFLFCFFIMYVCPSCHRYLIVHGGLTVPKKVTIHVTGFDTATGHLILVDDSLHSADPFIVYPGQQIRWKISGISHFLINNIVEKTVKSPAEEVFKSGPHPVHFFSKSWRGTIKDSTGLYGFTPMTDSSGGHYLEYVYKMVWIKSGHQHTFDPRIQIKLP